jgi:hypothetical protein
MRIEYLESYGISGLKFFDSKKEKSLKISYFSFNILIFCKINLWNGDIFYSTYKSPFNFLKPNSGILVLISEKI